MLRASQWQRPAALLGAAFACALTAACGPQKDTGNQATSNSGTSGASTASGDQPKIQLITNNGGEFWLALDKGMEAGQKEANCVATRIAPPGTKPTTNDQRQVFDQAVAAGVDGIGVSPIDGESFTPIIDKAVSQGINVITFDSDAEKSKRLCYIGTNNYEAGKRAGEEAVRLFPQGGNFVAFVGNMTAQNARDRFKGFQDAVAGKNITMLQEPFQDNADMTGAARRNVADAITKYGDKINGFLGIWAYNGPAIVEEVMQRGIRDKVKIICFDGDKKTLSNLEAGHVDASIIQKPYEFGRISTKLLAAMKRKGSFSAAVEELRPELDKAGMKVEGAVIDTGVQVVTPANAKEFIENLKKLGLSST
jgi:ribose transport system substrate-binding protein